MIWLTIRVRSLGRQPAAPAAPTPPHPHAELLVRLEDLRDAIASIEYQQLPLGWSYAELYNGLLKEAASVAPWIDARPIRLADQATATPTPRPRTPARSTPAFARSSPRSARLGRELRPASPPADSARRALPRLRGVDLAGRVARRPRAGLPFRIICPRCSSEVDVAEIDMRLDAEAPDSED